MPFLQNHAGVTLFKQNNTRHHSAILTTDSSLQKKCTDLTLTSIPPDISLIEHLCDQLGRHVFDSTQRIHNRQQLIQVYTREWEGISNTDSTSVTHSIGRRCQAARDLIGGHSRYCDLTFRGTLLCAQFQT